MSSLNIFLREFTDRSSKWTLSWSGLTTWRKKLRLNEYGLRSSKAMADDLQRGCEMISRVFDRLKHSDVTVECSLDTSFREYFY
jgi:hypothetical protein